MILKMWGRTDAKDLALMEFDIVSEALDCFEMPSA